MSGIKGNWTVAERNDGTGGNLEVAHRITAATLEVTETVTLPGIIIDQHQHDASAIISGTIDAARLPKGSGTQTYGIVRLAGTGAGLTLSDGALGIDTAALSVGLGLGTAAGKNVGTAAGQIPVLDADGKLPESAMPPQTFGGDNLGNVANEQGMTALSQATVGDYCYRLDTQTQWKLGSREPGAYADAANWDEFSGAVTSVAGKIGNVTMTQLGLTITVDPASDTTFPTAKAVAAYTAAQINALNISAYATTEALNAAVTNASNTYATQTALAGVQTDLNSTDADLDATKTKLNQHEHVVEPINQVPASGIITLTKDKTRWEKTITADTVLGFDVTALNLQAGESATFELKIKTGTEPKQILFGNNISWLNGDEPYFTQTNATYLLAFRTDNGGTDWLGSYLGRY